MTEPKLEWRSGPDFAELAEVLGINTDMIMMARPYPEGIWVVIYTPGFDEGDKTAYSIVLQRDRDGILQQKSLPQAHPDLLDELEKGLAERMKSLEEAGELPPRRLIRPVTDDKDTSID